MKTIEILDNGELALFIESLRLAGYDIITTEFFVAQDLIVALAAQGKLPETLPPLKTLLMPILCHSPKEQEDFNRHFDDWVNRVENVKDDQKQQQIFILQSVWKHIKQVVKNFKWFIIFALIALISLFVFIYDFEKPIDNSPSEQITTTTPIDSEGSPSTISTAPNTNLPFEEIKSTDNIDNITKPNKNLTWSVSVILFLLVFGGLLWYLWQRYKTPAYLTRKSLSQIPNIKQFFAKDINEGIFQSVGLTQVAQQLRKHTPITTDLLDLKATIKHTIKAGGWFTPVTGITKTIPEYLVLIDRTTFKDHYTHLIDVLVNQLIAQGVFITRYYFDGDPRHCYPENNELPPLLLTELSDHYPTHRLLIFSDGKGFIDPITGDIVPWIEQFSVWTQKTFFTLEQPEQWGHQEKLLQEANFLVMPANENGLTTLAELIKAEQWQPDIPNSKNTNFTAFPTYFNDLSQWWLERHPPDRAKVTELLKQIHNFLGKDAYYWFSACAVYPEIRWQLTVYLGYQLKLLNEERFAKLAHLPWFRYGYMPDWLRRRLVDDLSQEQEKAIRAELYVLWAKASDKPISDFSMEIAHEEKARLSKLGEKLLSKWFPIYKNPLRDYVFLSFMPGKLAVKISNNLFRYPKMPMKTIVTVIVVSLLVPVPDFVPKKPQYDQHALVVGINQYALGKINNIRGAVNDASLLRDALRSISVALPDNRVLLDANATRANFVRAWKDMLKQAKPGDTLIVTFSGDSTQISDAEPLDEKDNKDEVLIFHDFNPKSPFQGKITDDEIYELFHKAAAYKILFVVDASHFGSMDSIYSEIQVLEGHYSESHTNNIVILSAVDHDSLIIQEFRINNKFHGALSWYFAQALSGQADSNKNGYLEGNELENFLREKVRNHTNNTQFPRVIPRADRQSIIRISPTPIKDKDNDTIADNQDNCIDNTLEEIAKGVYKIGPQKGCPIDSDIDKVPDYRDDCPQNTPLQISKGVDIHGCPLSVFAENSNTVIAFATSPGKLAIDGEGNHSLYTKHLLKALRQKTTRHIDDIFMRVSQSVSKETNNRQIPSYISSLKENFDLYEKKENSRKIALVIGNFDYQSQKLKNPVNDVQDISDVLKKDLGFEVMFLKDLNQQAMEKAIENFRQKLREAGGSEENVGLFYYSGHGTQSEGKNYLIPIENNIIKNKKDLKDHTISLNDVLTTMEKASTNLNIIIIDSARTNFQEPQR